MREQQTFRQSKQKLFTHIVQHVCTPIFRVWRMYLKIRISWCDTNWSKLIYILILIRLEEQFKRALVYINKRNSLSTIYGINDDVYYS